MTTGDLVLTNGRFYTVDPARPHASAVAIRDGRFVAVGTAADVADFGGRRIDLGGRCVTPGLIDAHVHFRGFALGLLQVDLMGVPTVGAALQRVEARAAATPAGAWIRGWGWSQDDWPTRAFPTAAQLDLTVPQHPVYLRHKSGHAAWVNSAALRLAGIDYATPDPPGGQIQRDEAGKPTGVLLETAMGLVADVIPAYSEAQLVDALRVAQTLCWQVGLVGLHDFDGRDSFHALQTLHRDGELGLRVLKNIPAALVEHTVGAGLRSGFGDDWLRIGGIKIFADGALGPRTALMIRPYEGEPENRGIAVTEKEEMMRIAHLAYPNQLALTIHAIGDQAVHDVLDVYESLHALPADTPRPRLPNRIEHVQIIHPVDQPRLAALGVIASMQPTHATSDMHMADRYWGARAAHSYAFRTLLETGATVVFGSDCPIESIDPLLGIHAAVTRRRADGTPGADGWYPAQRFSMAQTIHAFTLAAAITSGQQARQGSITPGKLADLTLFDRDLFALPADELLDARVAATVVGGDFRYRTF